MLCHTQSIIHKRKCRQFVNAGLYGNVLLRSVKLNFISTVGLNKRNRCQVSASVGGIFKSNFIHFWHEIYSGNFVKYCLFNGHPSFNVHALYSQWQYNWFQFPNSSPLQCAHRLGYQFCLFPFQAKVMAEKIGEIPAMKLVVSVLPVLKLTQDKVIPILSYRTVCPQSKFVILFSPDMETPPKYHKPN